MSTNLRIALIEGALSEDLVYFIVDEIISARSKCLVKMKA